MGAYTPGCSSSETAQDSIIVPEKRKEPVSLEYAIWSAVAETALFHSRDEKDPLVVAAREKILGLEN